MRIPESPGDVNPDWLTFALAGWQQGVKVSSVETLDVIHGSASKIRLRLTYAPGTQGRAPDTLWVKIGLEPHSPFVRDMGLYEAEAYAYGQLIPELGLSAPISYYQQSQRDPEQVVLVLEDLCARDACFGLATRPFSLDAATEGVKALAEIHAKLPDHAVRSHPRLQPVLSWGEVAPLDEFVRNPVPFFEAARGYSVPMALHNTDRLAKAWQAYKKLVLEGEQYVLHGDSHVGNTFILPDGRVQFLDWQCVSSGNWAHDVMYFLVSALDLPDRRKHERALVNIYREALASHGRQPPEEEAAWLSYRRAIIFSFVVWLGNGDEFQKPEINNACFARAGAAMIDHDVFALLGA